MITGQKLTLGFAPTRRDVFSAEDAVNHKNMIMQKLMSYNLEIVDLEWLNDEGLLYDQKDLDTVIKHFRDKKVDAVFAPHCNFGTEDLVARLAKAVDKPLLLWGPRDEAPLTDGLRLRDTQCGLFATSKILRRLGVPFTYLVNSTVDSQVFAQGFQTFLAASNVVRAFRNLRIGQISTRPQAFWTVMVNEGELLERFNIEIVPISLVEISQRATDHVRNHNQKHAAIVSELKSKYNFAGMSDEVVANMAGLRLAITEWAENEGLSAIAIQCWNALQDSLGIMPCLVNSDITGDGLPVVCETDIHGAVSAIMAQAARMDETPIFFADWTVRHPNNDNAELLWHCGAFPVALKEEGVQAKVGNHYVLKSARPGVAEWKIKGGDITVTRFDGDGGEYSLLMGHVRGIDGPHNRGTYIWVETNDWPKWEEKLIRGPYIHHVAGVHGKVAPALYEACRYIPGLKPDPVEPTAEEISACLRGTTTL